MTNMVYSVGYSWLFI